MGAQQSIENARHQINYLKEKSQKVLLNKQIEKFPDKRLREAVVEYSKSKLYRIKNKYLFFEVFSYTDTRFNVLSILFKSCGHTRFVLVQNWHSLSSGLFSKIRYTINQAQSEQILRNISIDNSYTQLFSLSTLAKFNTKIKLNLSKLAVRVLPLHLEELL
ncbi:hypothetical protein FGO68_gene8322 [Halteria grandinella]|uniref:Uncharacterized protein n=1 Tax=Halteria grandinella TaxID=5974 RepID=A0A8J8NY47_HALGN|nr:hypothetical protein FGO68_gene8322 [Halteria grandinella]